MSNDILDIRDLIERFEELEDDHELKSEAEEFETLKTLLEELAGTGGDEQWRGDWYPITFIRDSYFEEYCEEFLKDCDMLPRDLHWLIAKNIDWKGIAEDMQQDYSEVFFDGEKYFYR